MNGPLADLALWWVALAGLVLGGIGCALGLGARRRHLAVKDQLLKIEEAARSAREREARRARLYAVIEQEVTVRSYLTIRNEGHGAARDFTVSIDGAALDRCPLVDAPGPRPRRPRHGRRPWLGAHPAQEHRERAAPAAARADLVRRLGRAGLLRSRAHPLTAHPTGSRARIPTVAWTSRRLG